MSLRIAGQAEVGTVDSSRSAAPRSVEVGTPSEQSFAQNAGTAENADHADVSNASQLLSLAKTLVPSGRQEKLATLAASVASGQYCLSASEVSRSIVQGLLKK